MDVSPLALRVATYNLKGGTSARDRTRELCDLASLAALAPHVIGLQECKWWNHDHRRHLGVAERMLNKRGILLESNSDGCHLALLVDPTVVEIVDLRHRTHGFHHGVLCVQARVHGHPLDLAVVHLAPSSPLRRELEAELFKLCVPIDHPIIAMGDWNAAPSEEAGVKVPNGVDPAHARRKLDTRAAKALEEAGLIDVGAHLGDHSPTVGHTGDHELAYRCDRILSTLPTTTFTGHQVHDFGSSDHRPVEACFDLAKAR
ncbi:endonuclease/exonuclease/phosphatase family protein [Actinomadura vinacea]